MIIHPTLPYFHTIYNSGDYIVHVYTSDLPSSGTDAGITVEILGERATSGKQTLLDMWVVVGVDPLRLRKLGNFRIFKFIGIRI